MTISDLLELEEGILHFLDDDYLERGIKCSVLVFLSVLFLSLGYLNSHYFSDGSL